jgi:O-antigen/teichoic acid export membrane protein
MNFRELLEIEFKVKHNMFYVMVFNTIDSLFLLSFVIIMPFLNGNLEYIVFGYVLSNLPGFLGLVIYLRKKYHYRFRFSLSKVSWLMKESFPLYGTVLLTALFQQADILLLKNLDTTYSVGIYAAAARLTTPLVIIPLAIITTAFPIIVKNREKNNVKTDLTNILVYKTLFLFAIMISLIISFRAEDFVSVIFGQDYVEAYLPMIILFWSYLFVYFNTFSMNLLTAYKLQKYNFYFTLILVLLNVTLILLLVSGYSNVGAAIAKFGAGVGGSIFYVLVLNKFKIHYNFLSLRIVLWSISITIIIFLLSYLPLYLYLILALIFVFYITLKSKFFNLEELDNLLNILNKSHWKDRILKIV